MLWIKRPFSHSLFSFLYHRSEFVSPGTLLAIIGAILAAVISFYVARWTALDSDAQLEMSRIQSDVDVLLHSRIRAPTDLGPWINRTTLETVLRRRLLYSSRTPYIFVVGACGAGKSMVVEYVVGQLLSSHPAVEIDIKGDESDVEVAIRRQLALRSTLTVEQLFDRVKERGSRPIVVVEWSRGKEKLSLVVASAKRTFIDPDRAAVIFVLTDAYSLLGDRDETGLPTDDPRRHILWVPEPSESEANMFLDNAGFIGVQ